MSNKQASSSKSKDGKVNPSSVSHRVEQFSGPVPHPDLLKKYDEVLPGLAERLVSLAELSVEAEVRLKGQALSLKEREIQSQERQEKQEHTDYRLGVFVALLVVMLFLSVAVFSIHVGAYSVAIGVVSVLAAIIWSVRRSTRTS